MSGKEAKSQQRFRGLMKVAQDYTQRRGRPGPIIDKLVRQQLAERARPPVWRGNLAKVPGDDLDLIELIMALEDRTGSELADEDFEFKDNWMKRRTLFGRRKDSDAPTFDFTPALEHLKARGPELEDYMNNYGLPGKKKEEDKAQKAAALMKVALIVGGRKPFYKRPVSATVGRLYAPLTAAALGSKAPLQQSADEEDPRIAEIVARLEKVKKLDSTYLSLGSGRPIEALKRVWQNPRTSVGTKLWGSLLSPVMSGMAALTRGDNYNPYADMITLYNKDPAILHHEAGHAEDFKSRKYPGLYALGRILPPIALAQEGIASRSAVRRVVGDALEDGELTPEEIKSVNRTNRVLGGGMGSYVGNYAGAALPLLAPVPALVGAGVGQLLGRTQKSFIPRQMKKRFKAERKVTRTAAKAEKAKKKEEEDVQKAALWVDLLTPEERRDMTKSGMYSAFADHGIAPTEIDAYIEKQSFIKTLLAALPPAVMKGIGYVSILTGVPMGIVAHHVERGVKDRRRKEEELDQQTSFYRNAVQGLESGLAKSRATV